MSRIEKALERAAQLRQESPVQLEQNYQLPSDETITATTDTFPIQKNAITISNQLLVTSTDPSSPIAEEYRKLKSALVSSARQEGFTNVLMVTSSIAGEGKSVTALNLALSLAQEIDHTVLLIDADLRRPSILQYLGCEARKGLLDILEGHAEMNETLIHTGVGRLVILPAGKVASNPVELFSSNRMANLLQEIKHRYPDRFVIIDTPPILPFAETRTLARLVDGVIFVIKERLTSRESVSEALAALKDTRIMGAVYNGAELSPKDDRYGHYYKHNYYRPTTGNKTASQSERS